METQQLSILRQRGRQIPPHGNGAGMVRAQDPLTIGEGLLVQRDRLARPSRRLVSVGSVVVAGCQGDRVVGPRFPDLTAFWWRFVVVSPWSGGEPL